MGLYIKSKEDKELEKLQKEIEKLQLTKERKVKLSTSKSQRDQLLKEIAQLETVKKNPSMLKNFGSTFSRGLKTVGKSLWSATVKGSRNLQKNSPEFQELAKKKETHKQPFSNLAQQFSPYHPNQEPINYNRPTKLQQKKLTKKEKKQLKRLNKQGAMTPSMGQNPWSLP